MDSIVRFFIDQYLKLFFVLTPFFVVTVFLALTHEFSESQRRKTAVRVTFAVIIITLALFWFGRYLFQVFDITLDAFRVGAGVLLFLSAISLVQGSKSDSSTNHPSNIAVVPLALPVTVGPATTGVLLIMGAETYSTAHKLLAISSLVTAVISVGLLLYLSSKLEKALGPMGIAILSKLTGLILSSIAAQMVLTGAKAILR